MINEQPRPGSVTVSPGSGIAYQTKFNVRGSSFSDYEDGSSMSFYKFGYRLYTGGPITWFHEGSELQTPSFWIVIKMYFRWHVLRLYLFVLLNPWDWQYKYIESWVFHFLLKLFYWWLTECLNECRKIYVVYFQTPWEQNVDLINKIKLYSMNVFLFIQ